jgi:hypothetical protein
LTKRLVSVHDTPRRATIARPDEGTGGTVTDGDLQRWMERPVSRRQVLRGAGRGALGMSALAAFLAAFAGLTLVAAEEPDDGFEYPKTIALAWTRP